MISSFVYKFVFHSGYVHEYTNLKYKKENLYGKKKKRQLAICVITDTGPPLFTILY